MYANYTYWTTIPPGNHGNIDLEKTCNDEINSTTPCLEDWTACCIHSVHVSSIAVVITTLPYPALLSRSHCTNTNAKTGVLMIKAALSVTEFQPHWEN